MVKRYSHRSRDLLRLGLGLVIVLLLVFISGFGFQRIDLTEEKRHTLTPATVDLLEELEDIVYVKVFLTGEFPAEYKRLERAIKERLDEMKAYGGDRLEYEFINPSASESEQERLEYYQYLQDEGLQYTNITIRTKDGISEKIIFPGALLTYRNNTLPVQLLKSNERAADPQLINNSVNNLEYEFARNIRRVTDNETPAIAFIQGHGELSRLETNDAEKLLSESYLVDRVVIDGKLNALSESISEDGKHRINKYDLIVIADPDSVFSDADQFHIDQFVMRGGKVIWFLDPLLADLDSLKENQQTMAVPRKLGIEPMLFTYGVRLNNNILLDRNCAPIGITTGMRGNQPQIEMFPWFFRPIISPTGNHPIIGNIDPLVTEFVSSLDTLTSPGIKKTILLNTSEYSRILRPPVRINLNIVTIDPDFGNNRVNEQPIGVLLEGRFQSSFRNRLSPLLEREGFKVLDESLPTNMMVISDGDFIKNRISADGQNYFTLGYDRYAGRKVYGNRDFLLNAVNYMLDEESLISVRSRSIALRLLDKEALVQDRGFWQALNLLAPVILMGMLGVILLAVRRRRFTKQHT